MGQFHHRPLMGQDLQRASYGQKDIMGRKLKRDGIILDGPDDGTGPNSERSLSVLKPADLG